MHLANPSFISMNWLSQPKTIVNVTSPWAKCACWFGLTALVMVLPNWEGWGDFHKFYEPTCIRAVSPIRLTICSSSPSRHLCNLICQYVTFYAIIYKAIRIMVLSKRFKSLPSENFTPQETNPAILNSSRETLLIH